MFYSANGKFSKSNIESFEPNRPFQALVFKLDESVDVNKTIEKSVDKTINEKMAPINLKITEIDEKMNNLNGSINDSINENTKLTKQHDVQIEDINKNLGLEMNKIKKLESVVFRDSVDI